MLSKNCESIINYQIQKQNSSIHRLTLYFDTLLPHKEYSLYRFLVTSKVSWIGSSVRKTFFKCENKKNLMNNVKKWIWYLPPAWLKILILNLKKQKVSLITWCLPMTYMFTNDKKIKLTSACHISILCPKVCLSKNLPHTI